MAIYRSSKEQIQEYYSNNRLNQSAIKTILNRGIEAYLDEAEGLSQMDDLFYEEKGYFIIGKGVDCWITEGIEEFNKRYHISTIARKPGEKAMSILKSAFEKAKISYPSGPDSDVKLYRQEIYEACNEHEYYTKRAKPTHEDDSRIETVIKDNGTPYWFDMYMAGDKQILSDDEANKITTISLSLLNHSHTKHLFESGDNIDIVYQFPLYFKYIDVECKALLDMYIINHTRKKIMPIDIKTIGDYILNFNVSIDSKRYDIQASFYTYGTKEYIKNLSALVKKDLSSYEITRFAFIVESTKKPGIPLVFVLSSELLLRGQYGGESRSGRDLLGWTQGITTFNSWSKKEFSIVNMFEDTNGVVFVDETVEYSNIKL